MQTVGSSTQGTNGLRERQLLRGTEDPDEAISLSIWDTLGNMRNYETGELRMSVAKGVEHLYTGQYWVKHFEIKPGAR